MTSSAIGPRSSARKFAIYRQWSGRHFYGLGVQHFLIGLHTPDRMATLYPTRDRHGAQAEADFIAGWQDTRAEHALRLEGAGVEWD